ncbi:Tetratricopeptide repeat protein 4 [Monoraphidium neglectum]|uniref:Tetratricopeptide repeat protein 4 n=1 Tax=Monoraphidium neglectum TaxID=145388 RepID=A0A0D2KHM3_9CHLO|nr:Tetratricopeptide repeat protein 4 [Monoraphidium neglectum]KIY95318.1 Tetratricopeptide repeat protein 4 [Monoraphidium neglectum]|eukprot:XP_013894338.1 Tetratricopeptide repeat protein 4 [Monoraphidium neglectum]
MSDSDEESPQPRAGSGGSGAAAADDPLDPSSLPALFWDDMPANPEEHPDYMALKAIADECTPEEQAESFKKQGNKKLEVGIKAKNRFLLREAIGLYGQGLALGSSESEVNVALLNNRAHVHSMLGNWRSALEDALAARKLDPSSVKAAFRAARAAAKLGRLGQAGDLVDQGLALDPANKDLLKLQQVRGPRGGGG